MGSIRLPRQAGMALASKPTVSSTTLVNASVTGSGVTP